MRWVGLEQIFKFGDDRKSASDYVRELELGSSLEVDGYRWEPSLWRQSFDFALPESLMTDASDPAAFPRPVKIVKLTRDASPLTKGGIVGYDDLKDFTWLYEPNREWVLNVAAHSNRRGRPCLRHSKNANSSALTNGGVCLEGTYHRPADTDPHAGQWIATVGSVFCFSIRFHCQGPRPATLPCIGPTQSRPLDIPLSASIFPD